MASTRLPGKVLKKILGKTLIEHLWISMNQSEMIDEIIIATSEREIDDQIYDLCFAKGFKIFRGSELDVLERYFQVASQENAEIIIRVCADSPLLDSSIIDEMISVLITDPIDYDYLSNTLNQTYPIGMNAEIMTFEALKDAHLNASKDYEREHVTPYIYTQPDKFKIYQKHLKKDYSFLRLTIDEHLDFELVRKVMERLHANNSTYSLDKILSLHEKHPSLFNLNRDTKQKSFQE